MTAIGETLRRERLRRNLDLESVSQELKISAKMLRDIEDERFERLPGGVFAKAFVRQYAHLLGLDEEEMAAEVQRQLQPELPHVTEQQPHTSAAPIQLPPVEEWDAVSDSRYKWSGSLPALALVVVVMMGCAGIYSWWQRARHGSVQTPAGAATASARPAPQSKPPVAPPAEPPKSAETTAQPQPQPNPTTAEAARADAGSGQAASSPTESKPPAAAPTEAANAAPNPNAQVHVELVAAEPVWVLARTDGKYLFSGTIEANETRKVEANNTVLLRVGNAGGVNITLNGKPIGAIGPKGQVRTVQLTPAGFEIVATAPKPPATPIDQDHQ